MYDALIYDDGGPGREGWGGAIPEKVEGRCRHLWEWKGTSVIHCDGCCGHKVGSYGSYGSSAWKEGEPC